MGGELAHKNAAFISLILGVPLPCRVFTFMANQSVSGSIVSQLKLHTSYLSSTEVMGILGYSRKTLCAWVRAGGIPAVRIGRDNKFDPWELALWIEAGLLGHPAHASGWTGVGPSQLIT